MLTKSDSKAEKEKIEELVSSDAALKYQHDLFKEEMHFKQTLIEARRSKELTQEDISKISGLSQQAVSRLEKGNGGNISTVLKYLSALGMALSIENL